MVVDCAPSSGSVLLPSALDLELTLLDSGLHFLGNDVWINNEAFNIGSRLWRPHFLLLGLNSDVVSLIVVLGDEYLGIFSLLDRQHLFLLAFTLDYLELHHFLNGWLRVELVVLETAVQDRLLFLPTHLLSDLSLLPLLL